MSTMPSPQEYEEYIHKNETWNFVVNILDLTFYNLAVSFIFGSTILSLYTSYLTSSAVLIGLIPAIQSVGYFLPQLIIARYSESLPRKKPLVQKISVMERLPYFLVVLQIFLWPDAPKAFSYGLLAFSLAVATLAGGLGGPAWNSMLAKVIHPDRRGIFFGLSHAAGGLLGVAGAALSARVLKQYPFPTAFGVSFALCFVSQVLSWIALSLNREPAREPTKEALSARDYWRRLPSVVRENPNFARYMVSRVLIILGGMGTSFYILYTRHAFQVDPSFAANLTIASLVSQTVFTPVLGWLADRRGHKWLFELSTVVGALALVVALFAPNATWFYGVFVLLNASTSGTFVSSLSILMDFTTPEELPTFAALANTIFAIPILVAPVIGGWLVDTVGYQPLFVVALILTALGWVALHWLVREPRRDKAVAESAQEEATA